MAVAILFALARPAAVSATDDVLFQDHFRGGMAAGWSWLREDRAYWRIGSQGLEVMVQPGNLWGRANNAKNVLIRPVPAPDGEPLEVAVTLRNEPTGQWEQVDLAWFYDEGNMVKLGQELVSGKLCVVMGREENDKTRTVGIVPLDSHTVQLRLLVTGTRIHGQYRTVNSPEWREVGDCDLPAMGPPRISLQFYQGPPDAQHWARVEQLTVRRLSTPPAKLEELRASERCWKSGQPPPEAIGWPAGGPSFRLEHLIHEPDQADGKSDAEQCVFGNRDGTYGWTWDRRAIAAALPNLVRMTVTSHAASGLLFPLKLTAIDSFRAELDVVSRLDADRGQHNLGLHLLVSDSPVAGQGRQHRLGIWFDWQGKDSTGTDVNDGFRQYGYAPGSPPKIGEVLQHVYRLHGFRGAPPRVNLKAFLDDAAARLQLSPVTLHLWQLSLGNEIWNNSKGRTLVRRLDCILNGQRCATVATTAGSR